MRCVQPEALRPGLPGVVREAEPGRHATALRHSAAAASTRTARAAPTVTDGRELWSSPVRNDERTAADGLCSRLHCSH